MMKEIRFARYNLRSIRVHSTYTYSWIELRAEPYRTESNQKSIEFECHLMMLALNAQYIHILNIMILMYKENWCCRESSDEDYHCGGIVVAGYRILYMVHMQEYIVWISRNSLWLEEIVNKRNETLRNGTLILISMIHLGIVYAFQMNIIGTWHCINLCEKLMKM